MSRFLRGLRNFGRGVLSGLRRVVNVGRAVRDGVNRVRDLPVVGGLIRASEPFIPSPITQGLKTASDALDVASSGLQAGDRLMAGDFRGAVSAGRDALQGGQRLRR
jgi:hypothetical protein